MVDREGGRQVSSLIGRIHSPQKILYPPLIQLHSALRIVTVTSLPQHFANQEKMVKFNPSYIVSTVIWPISKH